MNHKDLARKVCMMMHKVRAYLKCSQSVAMRLAWKIVRHAISIGGQQSDYKKCFVSFTKQEKRDIRNRNISQIFNTVKG